MANFTFDLEFKGLITITREIEFKKGKVKCLVIPIEENRIVENYKKDGYLLKGLIVELKQPTEHRTHALKVYVSKEEQDKMSDEQKKAIPWIGSAKQWGSSQSAARPNQANPQAAKLPPSEPTRGYSKEPEEDDLPF